MHPIIPNTTAKGGLLSALDVTAQYPVGLKYETVDKDGNYLVYEYWKNTTAAACVPNDAHFKSYGNIIQAEANNPQATLVTEATAQWGQLGLAQAAIPDEYFGWFLTYGPTTNTVGKLFFGNAENHTQTRTTTVGEPLLLTNGLFVDDTTYAAGVDGLPLHTCVTTEAVTAAISGHVFITGGWVLSAT